MSAALENTNCVPQRTSPIARLTGVHPLCGYIGWLNTQQDQVLATDRAHDAGAMYFRDHDNDVHRVSSVAIRHPGPMGARSYHFHHCWTFHVMRAASVSVYGMDESTELNVDRKYSLTDIRSPSPLAFAFEGSAQSDVRHDRQRVTTSVRAPRQRV